MTRSFASYCISAWSVPFQLCQTLLAVIVEIWIDMKSRLHSFCKINQACGINQSALTTVTFWGLLDSRQRPFPERARNNEPFSWHMVASQLQICSACLPRQPGTFCRCELQFEVWRLRPWGVAFDVYGADVLVRSCDQQHGKREINTWKLSEINRNHGTIWNLYHQLVPGMWRDVIRPLWLPQPCTSGHQVSWEL